MSGRGGREREALPPGHEDVLLAIAEEHAKTHPSAPVPVRRLAALVDLPERDCAKIVHDLARGGLVSEYDAGPGRSITHAASLSEKGSTIAFDGALVAPKGPVGEFAATLTPVQIAVLNVVAEQESRVAGAAPTRAHVRTAVRQRIESPITIEEVSTEIDQLGGSYLNVHGGGELSYRVTLRGLLASDWGRNALEIIEGMLGLLRDLHNADPGLFRYSWTMVRRGLSLPRKAANLFYITVTKAGLGSGIFKTEGDDWWATPPELDVVLNVGSALEHAHKVIGPTSAHSQPQTTPTDAAGTASPGRDQTKKGDDDAMSALTADPKKVFIIHGRNLEARKQMGIFLRGCGLTPINFDDLRAEMGGTPNIADIVERGMEQAQGVVALFTEDEYAGLRPQFRKGHDKPDDIVRWQGRPNVLFEAGMAFGRDRSRVVFVLLGNPILFTDVAGVAVLRPTNDPGGHRSVLRDTLRKGMRCQVEDSSDWMHSGDFETCINGLSEVSPRDPFSDRPATANPAPVGEVGDSAITAIPGVSLSLTYRKLPNRNGEIHHYELVAVLKNASRTRLDDWYIEVELPTALLEPKTTYGTRVRSEGEHTLFRTSDRQPILVGEAHEYPLPYRVDHDIYQEYGQVIDQWAARARAFVAGTKVAEAELLELQNF